MSKIYVALEYNDKGFTAFAENYPGASGRGKTKDEALSKLPKEVDRYMNWLNDTPSQDYSIEIREEYECSLNVEDADSDIIFKGETQPLDYSDYQRLKAIALKSATDFEKLYNSIPDINLPLREPRKCFYGDVPVTARNMYNHTKNVNSYYFGELGITIGNGTYIRNSRMAGFLGLEGIDGFLRMPSTIGAYNEEWSVRKLLRRFLWHDLIHAKAMYRGAVNVFGKNKVANPFKF